MITRRKNVYYFSYNPQISSYIVVGVGILATLYFHASVFYIKDMKSSPSSGEKGRLWHDFKVLFKNHNFYIVSILSNLL